MKSVAYPFCIAALVCVSVVPAIAQTVVIVQPLEFGSFTVNDNNAIHSLTVQRTGAVNADAGYTVVDNPVPAEWSLTGFPSFTELVIEVTDVTNIGKPSSRGEYFTLTNFTPTPSLSTDNTGAATLRFGATLLTSGVGLNYTDGTYSGTYDVTINY